MIQLEAKQLFNPQFNLKTASPRRRWHVWRLIGGLTLVFIAWLLLHWWLSPLTLPTMLLEVIVLAETAAAATLGCVWAILLWHRHKPKSPFAQTPTFIPTLPDLYALNPTDFEKYVAYLFQQKGYQVKLRGRRGDLGVDLELKHPTGKEAIVQCKRYQKTIGPDVVRELYGTLIHEQVAHAFLVTTAEISNAARTWSQSKPMTLIDGQTLIHIAAALAQSNPNGRN